MARKIRNFYLLVLLTIAALLLSATLTAAARPSTTVSVPQWNEGDKWGYKIPQYTYASTYYGVGFEVVGTETINGYDCYKVKIWWDAAYGETTDNLEMDFEIPGYSYSYKYNGFAYFTKEKLALAKFTNGLQMKTSVDISKMTSLLNTRQSDIDIGDYASSLEMMEDWKYDIDCSFDITYDYNPPFVMYDFPLEVGKRWNSTSVVSVNWEYSTQWNMNYAMKKDLEELGDGVYTGIDAANEEGSDSTEFTLRGSFEVEAEDTVTTDIDTYSVLKIVFEITSDYTRATRAEPPESYEELAVPGGDATLSLIGGTAGSGTIYYDEQAGYPQQIETGSGYFSDSYSTVDPTSIENSYNDDILDSSSFGSDKDSDAGDYFLIIFAAVIGIIILVVVILVVVLVRRMNRGQQQYPPGYPCTGYPPQAPPQQYPSPQQPYPQPPQQPPQPPQPPQQPPAYPPQR